LGAERHTPEGLAYSQPSMQLAPQERKQLGRLLGALIAGQDLARDCARAQAELARDPTMRRFFLAQARQERFHGGVFRAFALSLSGAADFLNSRPLARYRRLVEDAVARGDLGETLLAQQVILDGLGEVVLTHLDRGMGERGMGVMGLRRLVLHQEQAHHSFGLRAIFDADPPAAYAHETMQCLPPWLREVA
jgi:hypothetical protein